MSLRGLPLIFTATSAAATAMIVLASDYRQFGHSPLRNNVVEDQSAPTDWNVEAGQNIKWSRSLGSQTHGSPVIADGKVFIGTNNWAEYLQRYPKKIDLGVLLCFREADGTFLWQHSSEKLPTGRMHDWPAQGICSTPVIDGDRLWYVTNRAEVVCLDTEGYLDNEDDGPIVSKAEKAEADVVWSFDMMRALGVSQHNMANCSPTIWGDVLFVCTSNGVNETHVEVPAPDAPSFLALDKLTGKVLWTDNSPGKNILHGQWSSPAVGVFDGVAQVLFAGGDGWLYSFRADAGVNGRPEFLWKFDGNPKDSTYRISGQSTRNGVIAPPVVYDGLVYLAMGEDPEYGEGRGHLWCIDPRKQGDVSAERVVDNAGLPLPHQRLRANAPIGHLQPKVIPNPNSAVVWHYESHDFDGNGKIEFEEQFHRSIGGPAIKDDLLFITDFSGMVHCVHAKTGIPYWTADLFAAVWGGTLIVGNQVLVGDEDGDISVFPLSADPAKCLVPLGRRCGGTPKTEFSVGSAIYTTPSFANGALYIATTNRLFAIAAKK